MEKDLVEKAVAETLSIVVVTALDIAAKLNGIGDKDGAHSLCALIETLEQSGDILKAAVTGYLFSQKGGA